MKRKDAGAEIEVVALDRGVIKFAVVGTTPYICERMSQKVEVELLIPKGKKTASEKNTSLKHNPLQEFRDSPYTLADEKAPTLLAILAVSFKKAMMTAALDDPGTKRAQVGRLVRAEGERIALYGLPQMAMHVTRSADINHTPDIRSRAILPHWAAFLDVSFARPQFRDKSIQNLLAKAGVFSGVGGWRTEKGSGNYGSFRLADAADPELKDILKTGGRKAQIAALNSPAFYDDETEYLFNEFNRIATDRGFKVEAVA